MTARRATPIMVGLALAIGSGCASIAGIDAPKGRPLDDASAEASLDDARTTDDAPSDTRNDMSDASDAGVGRDAQDATDAADACTQAPSSQWTCSSITIDAPTSYCVDEVISGSTFVVSAPTPAACQCAGEYTCACITTHATACPNGKAIVSCQPFGGQPYAGCAP